MDNMKAVIFRIEQDEFGVSIDQVVSIERVPTITGIPHTAPHVLGVTTVRGEVIPVIDLHEALTKRPVEFTDLTRMIVIQHEGASYGWVVDAATDVVDIPSKEIEPVSGVIQRDLLVGIAKFNQRLIMMLNGTKLLQNLTQLEEVERLREYIS